MTGYIFTDARRDVTPTRDTSRDFTAESDNLALTCGVFKFPTLWLMSYGIAFAYDLSVTPIQRQRSRDFSIAGGQRPKAACVVGDYIFALIANQVHTFRIVPSGVPVLENPSPLTTVGSDSTFLAPLGDAIYVGRTSAGSLLAYDVSGNVLTANPNENVNLYARATARQAASAVGGHAVFIAITNNRGRPVHIRGSRLDRGQLREIPALSFNLDNTDSIIVEGNQGIYSLNPDTRGLSFYSGGYLSTLSQIDTIFYTDKDRHKIYPKKCWIVGTGNPARVPTIVRNSSGDFNLSLPDGVSVDAMATSNDTIFVCHNGSTDRTVYAFNKSTKRLIGSANIERNISGYATSINGAAYDSENNQIVLTIATRARRRGDKNTYLRAYIASVS